MKLSSDIIARIKEIEIQTSRLVSGMLIGDKQSAVKGVGFEFDQLRDYQMGDDIRAIDWKSSARLDKLLVKQYIEEHNRIIMLMIDGSASGLCSSLQESKYDSMARIAAVLALVAQRSKDQVGLLLFTDKVEHYIPPRLGRLHVKMIMNLLFSWKPTKGQKTNIAQACNHIMRLRLMPSTLCLISDFIDTSFEKACTLVSKRHEVIMIRCLDELERSFPTMGFIQSIDLETGQQVYLDARSGNTIHTWLRSHYDKGLEQYKRYRISLLNLMINKPFMSDLVQFFGRRLYN